jgi:hypothetical protein
MGKVVPLTVQNAEIKTAAVELKTLTVSGKQVTLAVFRQLIEAPLINHDGSLNGVAWGTVNYCPGKTCSIEHGKHWHVVWQEGTELRRSAVRPAEGGAFESELGDLWFARRVLEAIDEKREWPGAGVVIRSDGAYAVHADTGITTRFSLDRIGAPTCPWRASYNPLGYILKSSHEDYRVRPWLEAKVGDPVIARETGIAWGAELEAELARRKRHAEVREAIASLPQLFIAV